MSNDASLLKPAQAAVEMGYKSRQSIHDLINAGRLAWVNVGSGKRPIVRISRAAIAKFIAANEHQGLA